MYFHQIIWSLIILVKSYIIKMIKMSCRDREIAMYQKRLKDIRPLEFLILTLIYLVPGYHNKFLILIFFILWKDTIIISRKKVF